MFSHKVFLILLFAMFFSIHSNLYSQQSQNNRTLKISYTMLYSESSSGKGYSNLEMSVLDSFKKYLEANGLFSGDDFEIELLLDVKEIKETNKIAISVVEMNVLPKEAVEIGRKSEIFYSSLDEKKKAELTEEGRFIREYVSEEYLKQFRQIWNQYLEVIEINDLDNFTQKIISKFL
jgi:hypothetical protein